MNIFSKYILINFLENCFLEFFSVFILILSLKYFNFFNNSFKLLNTYTFTYKNYVSHFLDITLKYLKTMLLFEGFIQII